MRRAFACALLVQATFARSPLPCTDHSTCAEGMFCYGNDNHAHGHSSGTCAPCDSCHFDHDAIDGKCPCGSPKPPGDGPREGGEENEPLPAGPACKKHKDCPKTDFCSASSGCHKCKKCAEHDMSVNGKCPCGPARKRDKAAKQKKEL